MGRRDHFLRSLFLGLVLTVIAVQSLIRTVEKELCDKDTFHKTFLVDNPHPKDIFAHHAKCCQDDVNVKAFGGTTLGYVTPWNNHGYDVAKWFNSKFTYISPVWLQLRRKKAKTYVITGTHDIDVQWIKDVQHNSSVKIVPRILFDGWSPKDLSTLSNAAERSAAVKELMSAIQDNHFDGLVLEAWMHLLSAGNQLALQFIKQLAKKMQAADLDLILVVPPMRNSKSAFNGEHFNQLADLVTAFSLMTYDFSSPQHPGPNSPEKWIRQCVEHIVPAADDVRRAKILLGLNFYGNDYTPNGGRAIVSHEYLPLVQSLKSELKFDPESGENFFEVSFPVSRRKLYHGTKSGRHTVFYPTLHSINRRLKLAHELGTGISIWELGQGLDIFYQLL